MTYTLNSLPLVLDPVATYTVDHSTPTVDSQATSIYTPQSDPGYPPVIFFHQASGDEQFIDGSFVLPVVNYLSTRGFVCAASDASGDSWGNDAGVANNDALLTYIGANSNADITCVHMVGLSMGMVDGASWLNNTGLAFTCLSAQSWVGCCDLAYMHANEPFTTQINTAYGSEAAYLSAFDTRDPQTLAENGLFDDIPVAMWYGSSDTTAGSTESVTFSNTAPLAVIKQDVIAHFGIGLLNASQSAANIIANTPEIARTRIPLVAP